METLVLIIDTVAVLLVVLYSLRNEKRPEDAGEIGPFRLKPTRPPSAPARALDAIKRRRIRGL